MFTSTSFANRLSDRDLVIFLFHGVVAESPHAVRNYNRKHLEREEFIALLRVLSERGNPLTMDEVLAHCVAREPFPPRSFAITFDDGFENNASVAAPVLADLRLPATFYLTTGWVGTTTRGWADRLDACLEYAAPGALSLPWESHRRRFADADERIAILGAIRAYVKRQQVFDRDAFVSDVYAQCGIAEEATWSDPLDRKLTWAQARALASAERFTIGGHTHSHAMLSFCTPTELEAEIGMSTQLLRAHTGVSVRHYAYPEGLAHHYSDEVVERLKAHGITCCPTAIDGVNAHGVDPFHLRRVSVMRTSYP